MADTSNPNTPCIAYERLEKLRKPCRDLKAGWPTITDPTNAAVYLPRESMELPVTAPTGQYVDPWKNRISTARLDPMFRDAVDALAGKPFAKQPKPSEDTPPELVEFLDDVDLQGNSYHVFMLGRFANAIAEGIDFVLVDFPAVDPGVARSVEDEKRAGLAPFWTAYGAGSVIYWRAGRRGGEWRLLEVRLREEVIESDGEWGQRCVKQIRAFFAGNPDVPESYCSWIVYRENERKEWYVYAEGIRRPQIDIPLVDVSTDPTGFFEATPPLLDLAHLNLAHLRKASDLDRAQHEVGFPMFEWNGVSLEDAQKQLAGGVSSARFLVSPAPGGGAGYIEPAGTSWAALEVTMDKISAAANRVAGGPTLEQQTGNLTATGEAIRGSKSHSKLQAWVARCEDATSQLLYYTAIDMGLIKYEADSGWGSVELNKTFIPAQQNVDGVRVLADRNTAGKLSDESMHEALLRAELLPETLTFEDEQTRLAQQGPALGEFGRGDQGDAFSLDATDGASKPSGDAMPVAGGKQDVKVTQDAVLNGAQITAATAIVTAVAAGELPRDAGIGQLTVLFNLQPQEAEKMMGSAGTGKPTTPNPNPSTQSAPEPVKQPDMPNKPAPPFPPKPNEEPAA